jgi:hypothetical protein
MMALSSRTTRRPGNEVCDQRQAFATEVIDHREDAEAAAIGKSIRQEVEAPALVRPLRDRQRRPRTPRRLAPAAPAHLQPFLAIEAAELLVIHGQTFAAHQHE